MLTIKIRTVAALTAAATLSLTGVASAAALQRGPTSNFHPVTTTVVAKGAIQGGATGDGPFNEKQCEALGDKASQYDAQGRAKAMNGDLDGSQRDGAAAQALVDYGLDNGCFFTTPW